MSRGVSPGPKDTCICQRWEKDFPAWVFPSQTESGLRRLIETPTQVFVAVSCSEIFNSQHLGIKRCLTPRWHFCWAESWLTLGGGGGTKSLLAGVPVPRTSPPHDHCLVSADTWVWESCSSVIWKAAWVSQKCFGYKLQKAKPTADINNMDIS